MSEKLPVLDPWQRRVVHSPLVAVPLQDPAIGLLPLVVSGSEPALVPSAVGIDVVPPTVPLMVQKELTPQCPVRERLQLCSDQELESRLKCLKRLLGRQQLPQPTHVSAFGTGPMKLPAHVEDVDPSTVEFAACLHRFLGPEATNRDRAVLELIGEVASIREWMLGGGRCRPTLNLPAICLATLPSFSTEMAV